jgi:hypothetical protein
MPCTTSTAEVGNPQFKNFFSKIPRIHRKSPLICLQEAVHSGKNRWMRGIFEKKFLF